MVRLCVFILCERFCLTERGSCGGQRAGYGKRVMVTGVKGRGLGEQIDGVCFWECREAYGGVWRKNHVI